MKYAQAVITRTENGQWKITLQSDWQVEAALIGTPDDVLKELKHAMTKDWHKRSIY